MTLSRRLAAEALGTAFLLAVVVGSGIMGERLSGGNAEKVRTGFGQWSSEAVATAGLLLTILVGSRVRPTWVASLVAAYITGAYWFTASTSFANPAVTLARAATNTFSGVRPADVPAFIVAELVGGAVATPFAVWLYRHATSGSPGG